MIRNLLLVPKFHANLYNRKQYFKMLFYHSDEINEEIYSSEWYRGAYQELLKLKQRLKNVDLTDGILKNVENSAIIHDDRINNEMRTFQSLARAFIESPSVQQAIPKCSFSKPEERQPLILNSLTNVCDYLKISAQQRRTVRLTICPQVTLYHIWREALEEILEKLKTDMSTMICHPPRPGIQMGEQIISSCLQFLASVTHSSDPEGPSWMKLASKRKANDVPCHKWGNLLEMFDDLMNCLRQEKRLVYHVSKLEAMREGLNQIKDILADRDIGYKEARHQEYLVQKKLRQYLGHSSKCLFTLLMYYLYGTVRDIEVDVSGGIYDVGGGSFCLCIGKILTSDDEKLVLSGIKHLTRALGLFKFVWETAKMKGVLKLQGHVWCVGAKERKLAYRGNVFFVHTIRI